MVGNRFQKVTSRPRWEGVIFTDLDFGDPRISIFSAEPASELKDYIEYIWYMKWDINLYFGYGDCLRKMFW